ncbi:MAG: enoyl-CoA hydratase-related protein [Candidatus Competibacteraceae bacterium]
MDFSCLTVTIAEHIAQVELNRPHKANALDKTSWYEIRDAVLKLDQTPEVRVIILNGAGKYFPPASIST